MDGFLAAGSIAWQHGTVREAGDQGCYYREEALLCAATSERRGPVLVRACYPPTKPVIKLTAQRKKCL